MRGGPPPRAARCRRPRGTPGPADRSTGSPVDHLSARARHGPCSMMAVCIPRRPAHPRWPRRVGCGQGGARGGCRRYHHHRRRCRRARHPSHRRRHHWPPFRPSPRHLCPQRLGRRRPCRLLLPAPAAAAAAARAPPPRRAPPVPTWAHPSLAAAPVRGQPWRRRRRRTTRRCAGPPATRPPCDSAPRRLRGPRWSPSAGPTPLLPLPVPAGDAPPRHVLPPLSRPSVRGLCRRRRRWQWPLRRPRGLPPHHRHCPRGGLWGAARRRPASPLWVGPHGRLPRWQPPPPLVQGDRLWGTLCRRCRPFLLALSRTRHWWVPRRRCGTPL